MQASIMQSRPCLTPFQPVGRRNCVVHAFSTAKVLQALQQEQLKPSPPKCAVGDSVKLGIAVIEGKGKTRTQKLEGLIIATHGTGVDKTVKFRRIFQGIGVELTLPIHAPAVREIEVVRSGRVRRAKLFYLRKRIGKASRLKEVVAKRAEKVVGGAGVARQAAAAAATASA